MSLQQKFGGKENNVSSSSADDGGGGEKVLVAVKASKEIPKAALVWALTHVVQPGGCISLVVVVPSQTSGRRLWGFPRFAGDCANAHKKSLTGTSSEHKCEISDSCSQTILQLHNVYDPNKISVKIKIVSASPSGSVVAEAKQGQSNWVVLDKDLKNEEKHCMEELHCNIVVMRRSHPKVLRLNLVGSPSSDHENAVSSPSKADEPLIYKATSSSPELFTSTEAGTSSVSSSDLGSSPLLISGINRDFKKEETVAIMEARELYSETESEISTSCSISAGFQHWIHDQYRSHGINAQDQASPSQALLEKLSRLDQGFASKLDFAASVREVISLSRTAPPGPPPLCSICQHKAPVFGKPPKWFSYAELEHATGGFSQANFLAEGGYGSVHRGVLPDGQAIAVKQHKLASSQGDVEFCSEVEVLSCAQHRNVVMLIGYCIEGSTSEESAHAAERLTSYMFHRRFSREEVNEAIRKMSNKKAVGPDEIPVEVWKCLGVRGLEWLTSLFNAIYRSARMPDEWRLSRVIPLYKNRGDVQECNNYRGIKLLSHTMKLWEKVIEVRLRRLSNVSENQFGFMPGRSSIEAIHLLRSLSEAYRERKRNLHMTFIDLEKAYDRVPRKLIWRCLEAKEISQSYVRIIKDMYEGSLASVSTPDGDTEYFQVGVGLHQGSALSPFLFALVMDVLTRDIQEEVPWCLLFADDIVLVDESRVGVGRKLEVWREKLESEGFRLSRTKTEYVEFNFGQEDETVEEVQLEGETIMKKESFKYLGSILQSDGGIEEDIRHRIQRGWQKWRAATGVICDKKVPLKLKGKFYRTVVRPAILYGAECWPTTKAQEQKLMVTEMRMLRWMCGHTRLDRIKNEVIRNKLGVANICEKLREWRLRWFGHIQRRPPDAPVRKCESMVFSDFRRGRGRPKKNLKEVIKQDLSIMEMSAEEAMFRDRWRERITVKEW